MQTATIVMMMVSLTVIGQSLGWQPNQRHISARNGYTSQRVPLREQRSAIPVSAAEIGNVGCSYFEPAESLADETVPGDRFPSHSWPRSRSHLRTGDSDGRISRTAGLTREEKPVESQARATRKN